jgi:CDP-diacylglycerol pyrophosphatase
MNTRWTWNTRMHWSRSGRVLTKLLSATCVLTLILAVPGLSSSSRFASDALWAVVRTCESAKASVGLTFPCLDIRGSADGYSVALLRPPLPRKHLLVVPLTRIVGIESPELRGQAGRAYLSLAWDARDKAAGERGPIPWTDAGMAINSAENRTQDQLHIHVDCLKPQAKASLGTAAPTLGETWTVLWRGVWARLFRGEDLRAVDAFGPSIDRLPLGPSGMADLNFGVVGIEARGAKGFVLLASKSMSFEHFLDPDCTLIQRASRGG